MICWKSDIQTQLGVVSKFDCLQVEFALLVGVFWPKWDKLSRKIVDSCTTGAGPRVKGRKDLEL